MSHGLETPQRIVILSLLRIACKDYEVVDHFMSHRDERESLGTVCRVDLATDESLLLVDEIGLGLLFAGDLGCGRQQAGKRGGTFYDRWRTGIGGVLQFRDRAGVG